MCCDHTEHGYGTWVQNTIWFHTLKEKKGGYERMNAKCHVSAERVHECMAPKDLYVSYMSQQRMTQQQAGEDKQNAAG